MAEKNQNVQEQDMNQLLKVRRDKLRELQESGKDPFQITKYEVTHLSLIHISWENRMKYGKPESGS